MDLYTLFEKLRIHKIKDGKLIFNYKNPLYYIVMIVVYIYSIIAMIIFFIAYWMMSTKLWTYYSNKTKQNKNDE